MIRRPEKTSWGTVFDHYRNGFGLVQEGLTRVFTGKRDSQSKKEISRRAFLANAADVTTAVLTAPVLMTEIGIALIEAGLIGLGNLGKTEKPKETFTHLGDLINLSPSKKNELVSNATIIALKEVYAQPISSNPYVSTRDTIREDRVTVICQLYQDPVNNNEIKMSGYENRAVTDLTVPVSDPEGGENPAKIKKYYNIRGTLEHNEEDNNTVPKGYYFSF